MTNEMKLDTLKIRLNKIASRPDSHKTPGVMRKIKRDIRNLEKNKTAGD